MKKLLVILVVLSVCIVSFSCSSPESEGKKAGKKVARMNCNCDKENAKLYEKEILKFIKEFHSYGFTDIRQVDDMLQGIEANTARPWEECRQKSEKIQQKARNKYATNKQKQSEFEYAYYQVYRDFFDSEKCVDKEKFYPYQRQINDLINSLPHKNSNYLAAGRAHKNRPSFYIWY